jgi:hypothetical protein
MKNRIQCAPTPWIRSDQMLFLNMPSSHGIIWYDIYSKKTLDVSAQILLVLVNLKIVHSSTL